MNSFAVHIKQFAKRTTPQVFRKLKHFQKQRQFRYAHGGSEYRAKVALVKQFGKQVVSGPFAGMRYGDNVSGSAYVAKLLGSYEEELHPILHEVAAGKPDVIVDIGCAEGYYAVGFAKRLPNVTIYAYDIDSDAQEYCHELAALNHVTDQIIVGGRCDHTELAKRAGEGTFILCDCEGFELELLDPAAVPELAACDLLVELHDFLSPGLTPVLLKRFETTHVLTLIDTRERDVNGYPALQHVLPEDRPWAVREGRQSSMQWAYLRALTAKNKTMSEAK